MGATRHTPGPDADAAFRLGLLATTALAFGGVGLLLITGQVDLLAAVLTFVFGLPLLLLVVACLLSIWLGYTKEPVDALLTSPSRE
ncbi:hypothetical protein [Halomarina ordinaria]|uniref:Uncharacterized protein n=1 Tax=Halomarina ordinaria TaxID=3033939 RepID=A0ABD5U958_9EURY|nr:hypothetical protein [Halomarina sp. PSRA2]